MPKNQGKRNRQRGQEYEREIAGWFRELGFDDARRNLQAQGGKVVGNDLANIPFAVECKRTSASLIPKAIKALEQCDEDAQAIKDKSPRLVITRADQGQSHVVLSLKDFGKLIAYLAHPEPDFDYSEKGW